MPLPHFMVLSSKCLWSRVLHIQIMVLFGITPSAKVSFNKEKFRLLPEVKPVYGSGRLHLVSTPLCDYNNGFSRFVCQASWS